MENWSRVGEDDYTKEYEISYIPRIGERITFDMPNKDGDWLEKLYVLDIIHQFINNEHNIIIIVGEDLECVSRFHYFSVRGENL